MHVDVLEQPVSRNANKTASLLLLKYKEEQAGISLRILISVESNYVPKCLTRCHQLKRNCYQLLELVVEYTRRGGKWGNVPGGGISSIAVNPLAFSFSFLNYMSKVTGPATFLSLILYWSMYSTLCR